MPPAVSVWIPSYNHAPYLGAAIESVLGQTLGNVELVIVEDGSTDGSLEIATRYAEAHPARVRVVTHERHANRGVEESARQGVAHTGGEFLLGLGSDDMLYPDALERLSDRLRRRPELGFVYAYATVLDAAGRRDPGARLFGIDITSEERPLERLLQGNTIPGSTVMFRRACLEETGGHDDSLVYSDWELFVRVMAHWDVAFVPHPLAMFRVHGANTSMRAPDVTRDRVLAVTLALRNRALDVGGRLAEPRARAILDLQVAFLRFASGAEPEAAADARAAFTTDPALTRDGAWLANWIWSRSFDAVGRPDGRLFGPWFASLAGPLLESGAARDFDAAVGPAADAERARRFAAERRPRPALAAALRAALRSPRRAADRRLAATLLDSAPRSPAITAWRRARRLARGR